jgi:hypothetical protein
MAGLILTGMKVRDSYRLGVFAVIELAELRIILTQQGRQAHAQFFCHGFISLIQMLKHNV